MRARSGVSSLPSHGGPTLVAIKRSTLNPQSVCKVYPLIARNSVLSRENKLLIFRPVLTYAAPIWAHAAKTHINQFEAPESIILRQILNPRWFMRN
ncbi:hypothetical protein TNCV_1658071 [Trichonephila clavipes]|nr:hypothetical protein TNCV_1658071 [Trichonephila clavipes]